MMAVREFEEYVDLIRKMFREELNNSDFSWKENFKEFIKKSFEQCTNNFEEDTLIENLKEEFEDYLRSVKEN